MLRSIKDLIGYPIEAEDGSIGKVKSCLFDDRHWRIRYFVADTGSWLPKKKVLISPLHLKHPDLGRHNKGFPVSLTKEQVENCPDLDENAPISRQYEVEFASYYNQALYWEGPYAWGPYPSPTYAPVATPVNQSPVADDRADRIEQIEGTHLRSASEVIGYAVAASDGEFGYVDDLILDDDLWKLQYAVISSRKWLPGRKFLIDIDWIADFDWSEQSAAVELSRKQIESSPKFDASAPVNRDYLNNLYDFYGKPHPEHETAQRDR